MPTTNQESSSAAKPPSSAWVRFLRNYGPIPTNGNLFDEHISKALARAKVAPITLPSPRVDEMEEFLRGGLTGSILVAGTAGDGKTYHCRELWKRLGGDHAIWASDSPTRSLNYGGREIVFVKDLSELSEVEGFTLLEGLEHSVAGNDAASYVIATNHGQILDRLRKRGEALQRVSPLRDPIQDAFLNAGASHPRLKIFDLSRSAHRRTLGEILDAVLDHPEWSKCQACPYHLGDRICPIATNRSRILGHEDGGLLRKRLGDLVELSRINGAHLPIRDLLALTANALLGHPDAKEGLMTCNDVPRLQEQGAIDRASVYRNLFGANLPRKRAMSRPVFRTLAVFGVGEETANGVDGLLVYGSDDSRLQDAFRRLVASDAIYGASPGFLSAQRRYLEGEEGAREENERGSFLERLADQRRRLFFTLPDGTNEPYSHWGLTAFRHAGAYIELMAAVESKGRVDERTRSALVRGLNRVVTGLLLENADKIFVAGNGGSAQSRISTLCETEIPARRDPNTKIGMVIRHNELTQMPCLNVHVAVGQPPVTFDLTPVRFEFLCRVADGALPGSFSNECLEDLLALKARLLRQAESVRSAPDLDDDEPMEESAMLGLSFIEINDGDGHGALRRFNVRTPA